MLITTLDQACEAIKEIIHGPRTVGLDVEGYGLNRHKGDRLFSIIIHNGTKGFYFNFKETPDHLGVLTPFIDRKHIPELFKDLFAHPNFTWYIHNAKYDIGELAQEGTRLLGTVKCTQIGARIERNDHLAYKLENCLARIGEKKSDAVKEYCEKHKLWSWRISPGKKKKDKDYHFSKVPTDVLVPYAIQDAYGHLKLGQYQAKQLEKYDGERLSENLPSIQNLYRQEMRLLKTVMKIEDNGILLDLPYIARAKEYEIKKIKEKSEQWENIIGLPFNDSPTSLVAAFERAGEEIPRTAKGNPSFAKDAIEGMDTPLAKLLTEIRGHNTNAFLYYQTFQNLNINGVIHTSLNQDKTATGRFSSSNPNLQNQKKIEKDHPDYNNEFLVRRSFIPRPGHFFAMIDQDQVEYRLMLIYANEKALLEEVRNGKDVHQATADLLGITRTLAKRINFALLYGVGNAELARILGLALRESNELKALYFAKLPAVEDFISQVKTVIRKRGFIYNWAGRRAYFPRGHEYKGPNYLIQGGCADIMKKAMIEVDDFLTLEGVGTKTLLQVHDELLFEIPDHEAWIIPKLKDIVENAYVSPLLKLTAGVDISRRSWQDKQEWAA